MSVQDFDQLTRANMEVALERACQLLPPDRAGLHTVRSHLAQCITDAAEQGQRSLSKLTEAGRQAALDLAGAQ